MARVRWTVCCAAALTLLPACRREEPPASAATRLKRLEGVIDHGRQTFDPELSRLYVRASRALEAGDVSAAEAVYREAIAKYPNDPDGYKAVGTCLYLRAAYDEAVAEYGRALRLDATLVGAHYGLGCVAHKQGRLGDAKAHLGRALELDPNDAASHRVLGIVYDETGDAAKAVTHFERALELNPSLAPDDHARRRLRQLKR